MPLTDEQLKQKRRDLNAWLADKHNVIAVPTVPPYIVGVGFGLRETDHVVDTPLVVAFRIYFDPTATNKHGTPIVVPADMLPPEEFPQFCTINTHTMDGPKPPVEPVLSPLESPLLSGSGINSGSSSEDGGLGNGTLGFFATLNSALDKPKNVVLVSNHHVLMEDSKTGRVFKVGDDVWNGGGKSKARVARIVSKAMAGDFAYGGNDPQYVDCAAAQLIDEPSSCCRSICANTVTQYRNEVKGLGTPSAPVKIKKVYNLTHLDLLQTVPYEVRKSGIKTGLTLGRVIDVMAPFPKSNVIIIQSIEMDGNGNRKDFVKGGDSGAALLNTNDELVGLVYARWFVTEQSLSFACHIEPVIRCLEVTPVTTETPVIGSDALADTSFVVDDPRAHHGALLRDAFQASTAGRELGDLLLTHRSEILHLVNTHRRVTVAWHRHKGPGFVNHLIKNVRDPGHRIPAEIDGVTREALIRTMARVLSEHGSAGLAALAANHLDQALEYARRFDSLHELADGLKKEELT